MVLKYWEDQSAIERKQTKAAEAETIRNEVVQTEVLQTEEIKSVDMSVGEECDNLVELDQVRREKEEKESEFKEVDEYFESGDDKLTAGKVFKYILVDGFLGIPFLTICYILIAVCIAALIVLATAFTVTYLVMFAAAICILAISFISIMSQPSASIFMIGSALLTAAVSLLTMLLSLFMWRKAIPATAGLCRKLERALNLFGKKRK